MVVISLHPKKVGAIFIIVSQNQAPKSISFHTIFAQFRDAPKSYHSHRAWPHPSVQVQWLSKFKSTTVDGNALMQRLRGESTALVGRLRRDKHLRCVGKGWSWQLYIPMMINDNVPMNY